MKIGILGCGHIATKMAEAIHFLEKQGLDFEAYAVASRTSEKAKKFAEDYHFKKAYGSYQELACDSNVDLIYIATPHSEHYENAKLCLNAGRNLLVEKAFTANALQASEIIALAEEKGLFLCEAMWTRFLPAIKMLKTLILNDRIGTVQSVEAEFSMPLSHIERLHKPELAGGALLDLGIYTLTFADLLFSDPQIAKENNSISQIQSHSILFDSKVDATDWISLSYKNGQKAFLKTSMVLPIRNEGFVFGTKGFIKVQNLNDMIQLQVFDSSGTLLESIETPRMQNCYEYELLACKEALTHPELFKRYIPSENRCIWEHPDMPHSKTMEFMEIMDSLRNSWGVSYPFEQSPQEIWDRSHDSSYLQIFDIETGEVSLVKEFDGVIEAPNWSPDGKFLTYNAEGKIYKLNLYDNSISLVQSHFVDNCNNDHVLSPDGLGLYVSHHTKEDGLSRIYKIFFDGSSPELVTPLAPSYLHGITPDGKHLAYCAERNGEYDIYTIPSNGGNETRLTTAKGLNDGPEYDFQGEWIYFNSARTGRMQAWRMKANGTEQTQLTFDPHFNTWFPHISPDNQKIVMLAYHECDVRPQEHIPNKNVEIRLMERHKDSWSEPKTILKLFGGQGTINVNSWAPDSKRFAFVSYKQNKNL